METLLTVAEVAAVMKLKEQTIRRMALRGEIPCRKIGKVVRFSPSEIERRLETNGKNTDLNSGGLFAGTSETVNAETAEGVNVGETAGAGV
jgi:excisionase family DNA binding protein